MTTTPVHSITDEQIAEIEARCLLDMELLRKAAYIRGGGADKKEYEGVTVEAIGDVLGIITRLREAEKDAARYQWLRDKQTFIWMIQDWFPDNNPFTNVDAAIDTAMQGDK